MRKKNSYSRFVQAVSSWGENFKNYEKGKMINLLHFCVEQDITSFQASDFEGVAIDRTFGTALSESGLTRNEIQLIAKYRTAAQPEKNILKTVDDLLITLRTDYLDLLLLEDPEPTDDVLDTIKRLAFQGKVLEFGGLELNKERIKTLHDELPLKANETKAASYGEIKNLLDSYKDSPKDINYLMMLPSEKMEVKDSVSKELCEKYSADPAGLMIAWMLQHPIHVHPVINNSEEDEISSIIASKEITLDPVDWQKINLLLS